MMKKTILLLLSIFCLNGMNAQELRDTIKSRNIVTEINFLTDEIVHVKKYKMESAPQRKSLVVLLEKQQPQVAITEETSYVQMASSALGVRYSKTTGTVSFLNASGNVLLREKAGSAEFTSVKDGAFDAYKVKQSFTLQTREHLYGLGQIQNGNWNQRSQTYNYMIEGNTCVWIPYVQSNLGYSLFWDNASPTTYQDQSDGLSFESSSAEAIDYYFMLGSDADGQMAVQRMRQLSGQVPMIPLWAYGYFQSKERYESADETMSVMRRYRQLGIPIDCVVQDWQYWGDNNLWNGMEFANPRFSNYQQMIDSVHNMDGHLLISVWANFGPDSKPYKYFKDNNMLIKQGDNIMTVTYPGNSGVAIYDPYNPEARDAYWRFLFDGIASKGVDAYWMDSSEPDHYQSGTDMEQTFNYVTGMGCTWRAVRNAFPLLHVNGVYEHHRAQAELTHKRCMILTRSGYAGIQRTGANTWSGDVTASWQTFKNQIPAALSYTVCGNPNWNSDIGAFFNGNLVGPGNDEYNELYARWFQFATFCPMMRSHGSGTDKAIYVFGNKGTKHYDNIEKYIRLRYALLPYIYSTAWTVHNEGRSFMNPLALLWPKDTKTLDVKDEFLFGQSLLISPVTDYKARSRSIYLPEGKWADFWTGTATDGGKSITSDAYFNQIPIYVKAGTILPWAKPAQHADIQDWDTLQVRIYPGADGQFTLYEDEGDNYNYESGRHSAIDFAWDDAANQLTISNRQGSFDGMIQNRVFDIVLVTENHAAADQLQTTVNYRLEYDGTSQTITVNEDNIIEVSYEAEQQAAAETQELLFSDFNPSIQGSGRFLPATKAFTPAANGFGGWWCEYSLTPVTHKYMVAELATAPGEGAAFRVYVKNSYASVPITAKFSATSKKVAVPLGDASFIYGVGFFSRTGRMFRIDKVYQSDELPSDIDEDAASPYQFVCSEWLTGDRNRVAQSNISYNRSDNTITIKATGTQNAALQLNTTKTDSYYITTDKKFFCVKGRGMTANTTDAQLWFSMGAHLGWLNPVKVFTAPDGDTVLAWDISSTLPPVNKAHICLAQSFITCFGMTSANGSVTVSDINFYAEDELNFIGTGIQPIHDHVFHPSDNRTYNLSGRVVHSPNLAKGIYINNRTKYLIK